MALLWVDGFEGYDASDGANISVAMARRYPTLGSAANFQLKGGRVSGWAWWNNSATGAFTTPALTTNDTITVGVAIKLPTGYFAPVRRRKLINLYDGATFGMNVSSYDNTLAVYKGDTLMASLAGCGIQENIWFYLEFKVKCNSSTGTYEVRLNGANVPALTATGQNTKAGSNNYHDKVKLQADDYHLPYFDDYYITDGSGSLNTGFLGQQRVLALFPTAAGDTNDWTPSANAAHYTLVDENPINTTDYVYSSTDGQVEIFNFGDYNLANPISGVQVSSSCNANGSPEMDCTPQVKSGGNTANGPTVTVNTANYTDMMGVFEIDPGTGNSWTVSGINAAQFGMRANT